MLLHFEAINEFNQRINKDEIKVYCTGDLIDGGVNRQGDLLLLDYAEEWFDAVVIGNHELPFFGGPAFTGLRKYDRELRLRLLELEQKGVYVPSVVVGDYLLTHAGFAERWSFQTAQDADDVIRMVWRDADDTTKEVPMLDWIGPGRAAAKWANPCGGVFWADWSEVRNQKINQIVGHSTKTNGPICIKYDNAEHWNIDVGGKYGCCLGGVVIDDIEASITPFFWGTRVSLVSDWEYGDYDPEEIEATKGDDISEEDMYDQIEDETSMWRELMEQV